VEDKEGVVSKDEDGVGGKITPGRKMFARVNKYRRKVV
jgi:hypothetical protein